MSRGLPGVFILDRGDDCSALVCCLSVVSGRLLYRARVIRAQPAQGLEGLEKVNIEPVLCLSLSGE